MYHHNPNWPTTFHQYLAQFKGKEQTTTHLSFEGFGMNWGIWHYDLGKLFEPFVNLESINFRRNYIDTMVVDFSKMPKLKKIDFSHNALYYWGQEGTFRINEQFKAPNLEALDLSEGICGYIIIKQNARMLRTLKWLDLSGNYFTHHSAHDTEKPPVLKLPAFEQLEYLGLRNNHYTYVPKLRYLKTIKKLDLSLNPIRCNFQELELLPNLESLSLVGCGLTKIPKALFKLKNLKKLQLQGNALDEKDIQRLKEVLLECVIKYVD